MSTHPTAAYAISIPLPSKALDDAAHIPGLETTLPHGPAHSAQALHTLTYAAGVRRMRLDLQYTDLDPP
jgi:hypothetical protein